MAEEWTKLDQSRGCGGFAADKRCRPDLGDGDGAGRGFRSDFGGELGDSEGVQVAFRSGT